LKRKLSMKKAALNTKTESFNNPKTTVTSPKEIQLTKKPADVKK
jgi:hypothetical protein